MKRSAIVALVALFASASLSNAQEPPAGDGVPQFAPVTWERLVNAADEPHNWLMYNGTLDSKRFSRLDRIDRTNVGELELKWGLQHPPARPHGDDAAGGRRRDVHHRVAEQRDGGGCDHRAALLAL